MAVERGAALGGRALHVFVRGQVQQVGFRWATKHRADQLGVKGWVRNLADLRVEAWIEGDPDAVAAMHTWLAGGPSAARVDDVEQHVQTPAGHDGFELRPTPRT